MKPAGEEIYNIFDRLGELSPGWKIEVFINDKDFYEIEAQVLRLPIRFRPVSDSFDIKNITKNLLFKTDKCNINVRKLSELK